MLTNVVSFYCEEGGVPGGSWTAEVQFRPLKKGFSVWQRLSSFEDEPFRFRKVGGSTEALTWRQIVEFLRSPAVAGLGGAGLIDSIVVRGLPSGWMSDLCAIAWIQFENELDPILNRLLDLNDDEIALYSALIGPFAEDGVLSRLEELEDALQPLVLEKGSLARIQQELGWHSGMDWEAVIDSARDLGRIYSLAAIAGLPRSSLNEITDLIGLNERSSLSERIEVLSDLADAAELRAQATRDLALSSVLSESPPEKQWSKEFLEYCFAMNGRLPDQFAQRALLDWISLTEKPIAQSARTVTDPKLQVLSWILSSCSGDRIVDFAEEHPDEFNRVLAWLDALLVAQTNELTRCESLRAGFVTGPMRSAAIARVKPLIAETTRTIESLRSLQRRQSTGSNGGRHH